MNPINTSGYPGLDVKLTQMNPRHFSEAPRPDASDNVAGSFSDALFKALGKVNDMQADAEDLNAKMIHDPESVNVHTVMIAMQKAEMALTFTRTIRDEAIKTYRELMNLR